MASPTYSATILKGLLLLGLSEADISTCASLTVAQQRDIIVGTSDLSDEQIQRIELTVGLTAAQLAALELEPNGGPLTTLGKVWADARLATPQATDTR